MLMWDPADNAPPSTFMMTHKLSTVDEIGVGVELYQTRAIFASSSGLLPWIDLSEARWAGWRNLRDHPAARHRHGLGQESRWQRWRRTSHRNGGRHVLRPGGAMRCPCTSGIALSYAGKKELLMATKRIFQLKPEEALLWIMWSYDIYLRSSLWLKVLQLNAGLGWACEGGAWASWQSVMCQGFQPGMLSKLELKLWSDCGWTLKRYAGFTDFTEKVR